MPPFLTIFFFSIKQLAETIKQVVGYDGEITFDKSKPDGIPKKLIDSQILNSLGFVPEINLKDGLHRSYQDFLNNYENNI